MPVHTRSITKKLIKLGNGGYAFTSISETGEGIHTRFEYGDCYNPDQLSKALGHSTTGAPNNFESSFSSNDSATRTMTSSLSTISSGSSSDQSTNSMFDSSLPSIPSSSSSVPEPSAWDSYHNLALFTPSGATSSNNASSSSRPLQRTSAQRWVRDSETGNLRVMLESNSWPSVQTASSDRSEPANRDQIFEREYEKVMQNRDYIVDLTRKLIALEELDEDMEYDTLKMFSPANKSPVEEAPQVTSGSTGKPLGPEGTELVDETFRAPPGELGVYPEQWVTHRSTLLQPQPTELNVS